MRWVRGQNRALEFQFFFIFKETFINEVFSILRFSEFYVSPHFVYHLYFVIQKGCSDKAEENKEFDNYT